MDREITFEKGYSKTHKFILKKNCITHRVQKYICLKSERVFYLKSKWKISNKINYGRTLTSEQKFLSSIGYQIFLPMVLRFARWSSAVTILPIHSYS